MTTLPTAQNAPSGKLTKLRLAIVVPCYNEAEVLGTTIPTILALLNELKIQHDCSPESFVLYVDDGSRDGTWQKIQIAAEQQSVRGLRLACNVGHQGALLAGLDYVTDRCDAAVSIDADLQDDLAAIPTMIREYRNGAEIVLGVRKAREIDGWFKRSTAIGFYKLMRIMGVDLVENHADFRLLSARVLKSLRSFSECNLFLRAFPPLLHSNTATVTYDRLERLAGESKYPLQKMLALAWNGITSFSVFPLRLVTYVGGIVFTGSLFLVFYSLIQTLRGMTIHGWASITVPLYLLGGLIMLSVGIVGEYIGKIFLEVKRRPRFLIDSITDEIDTHER
jgi:glycosyltransferase involved in cell wall biosynthesis